ncbi:MAG: metal-dependent hydrolase [Candidatus Acidiferrales bacterium]
MDTITHGIAGALIGKGYFSERAGKVGIFAATLGAMFPDSDFVTYAFSSDPLAIVKYHRGITHSFVAMPVWAALLAAATRWIARRCGYDSPSWTMLTLIYAVGLSSHILLDGLTSFGTRMWTPISQRRVAWDWLFIIDFVFTALLLAPQVAAWVHSRREGHLARAAAMWVLFTLGAVAAWRVTAWANFPFHAWVVVLIGVLFAALFFLPASGGWSFQLRRATWCRAGFWITLAYVIACGFAHHAALAQVKSFAAANNIAADRLAALPLPPSLLDWSGAIRSSDGVYRSRFDLRQPGPPAFEFAADSPRDPFISRALALSDVRLFWNFARFPVIRSAPGDDGTHIVTIGERRSASRDQRNSPPFTLRIVFDSDGNEIEEGWEQDVKLLDRMKKIRPSHPKSATPPGAR